MDHTWLESIYSDGSAAFVSDPSPRMGDTVTVRIRFYEDAPVGAVVLRCMPNGQNIWLDLQEESRDRGFVYWSVRMPMWEKRMHYHFCLVADDGIYYYNQHGVHTRIPDHTHDFVLLSDYVQPEWVKSAVFYQIFPERFCNGDPANDLRAGELVVNGYPSIQMRWEDDPLDWEQGHCMDFFGGDLQGIREKIPYLKELGVTALYLNPIFDAPSVHKYDCIDYFHVDEHFGGDEALAQLSAALHENGMKLILDISINHTGAAHRWFNRDGLYFDKSIGAYNNPDAPERKFYFFHPGNTYTEWKGVHDMPTLNYTSEELRDIIYRGSAAVLRKWLKPPYSIDGWRFDVADTFARKDELQLAHRLWPEIRQSIRSVNPQAYILAEDWGDCAQYLQGNEWDAPMNYYGCGRVIRQFLGQPDLFMAKEPLLRDVPYHMTARDMKNRVMEHLAKLPYVMWENQFNLFDSHDASRLHNDPKISRAGFRGAVIFQFLLTGAASVYYGDEAEIDGTLGAMEGCRYPMPWDRDITVCDAYRVIHTMAHLKANHKALSLGGMKFLYAEGCVVAIARFWEGEVFVGVISTETKDVRIRLPLGAVGACEPKESTDIFGIPLEYHTMADASIELTVKAGQSYLMECR